MSRLAADCFTAAGRLQYTCITFCFQMKKQEIVPIMGLGVEGYPAAAPTSLDMTAVNNKQNFGAQTCRIKYLGI